MNDEKLLKLAVDSGEIILKSGGEIQRVEDTMSRIMATASTNSEHEAIVFPTAIFATLNGKNGQITKVKRIYQGRTDLKRLDAINTMSRNFVSGKISLDEALKCVEDIKNMPEVNPYIFSISISMTCLFFSLMIQGSFKDIISSGIIGLALGMFMIILSKNNVSYFISRFISGMIISILAIMLHKINMCNTYENVITACIMPILSGITITTSLRDILNGDFVSGISRAIEGTLVAVAIACGVMIVLKIFAGI